MATPEISFNDNIFFNIPTEKWLSWVEQNINLEDYQQPLPARTWPSTDLLGINFPYHYRRRGGLKLNRFLYPNGFSNWAEFNGIVDEDAKNALNDLAANDSSYVFLMDDGTHHIETDLSILSVRPLAKIPDFNALPRTSEELPPAIGKPGFYLCTLVDDRWFQMQTDSGTLSITASTTWNNLYTQLANVLEITLTVDTIPAAYGQPSQYSMLNTAKTNAPLLLNAVAFNVGQRIVRLLDGTYRAMSRTNSDNTQLGNFNNNVDFRIAGGDAYDPEFN